MDCIFSKMECFREKQLKIWNKGITIWEHHYIWKRKWHLTWDLSFSLIMISNKSIIACLSRASVLHTIPLIKLVIQNHLSLVLTVMWLKIYQLMQEYNLYWHVELNFHFIIRGYNNNNNLKKKNRNSIIIVSVITTELCRQANKWQTSKQNFKYIYVYLLQILYS